MEMTIPDTPTVAQVSKSAPIPMRRARALIGWLPLERGAPLLSGPQAQQGTDPAHLVQCGRARAAVARRSPGVNQSNAFADFPPELQPHIKALEADPTFAGNRDQYGEPRLVDLSRICAAQPQIFIEDAARRVEGVLPGDLTAIAQVTLPLSSTEPLPVGFDQSKQAWLFSSPNPNLRVLGQFNGPVTPGLNGFGFMVAITKSYMNVAGLGGRYFLRDGYHRAFGLLAAGITVVPAFVKEFQTFEEVGLPPGLLPQSAYLGDRPPFLSDYTNDEVSAEIQVPVTQKVIVVQALELHTLS